MADIEPLLDMTLAQLERKFGSAAGFRKFMRAKLDAELEIEVSRDLARAMATLGVGA